MMRALLGWSRREALAAVEERTMEAELEERILPGRRAGGVSAGGGGGCRWSWRWVWKWRATE